MAISRSKTILITASYKSAFTAAEFALIRTVRAKITCSDEANGVIQARTSLTFRSAGEIISAKIKQITALQCEITLTSRSRIATTLFDWGKNLENLELFEHDLQLTFRPSR